MNPEPSYPAKLLLFGEYSILLGSSAIGMPIKSFKASLSFVDQQKEGLLLQAEQSNMLLKKLCDHYLGKPEIFNQFLDLNRFKTDITQGLYLASTIPQRFGMGSSGALCAAIYGRYGFDGNVQYVDLNKDQLIFLRKNFIQMESYFHGKSSGFDPLVIYLQKTILFKNDGGVVPIIFNSLFNNHMIELMLIDSGLPRSSASFVQQFLDQFVPGGIILPVTERLIGLTNSCIDNIASEKVDDFWSDLLKLSQFQLQEMSHLIPAHLLLYWTEGLQSGLFALKLCGSGGGGFLTCFTRDKVGSVDYFRNREIGVVEV